MFARTICDAKTVVMTDKQQRKDLRVCTLRFLYCSTPNRCQELIPITNNIHLQSHLLHKYVGYGNICVTDCGNEILDVELNIFHDKVEQRASFDCIVCLYFGYET